MGGTADPAADQSLAGKLGFKHGQLVQEFGYDDDVDDDLRESIEDVTGEELLDEDADDIVDVVLLWWREEDGDLVDGLVDVLTSVAEGGVIWLLTPKSGRPGHVEPSEIQEAAPIAGLHATKSISAGKDWAGTRLVAPSGGRKG
ncbi:MAG TPA: DUF3052 domain-containing protein [Actinomycetales bacterium]|nr:DUF3052 domain-containing protein [Actinomycetales bacterium]